MKKKQWIISAIAVFCVLVVMFSLMAYKKWGKTESRIYCIREDTYSSYLTYEQVQQLDEILSTLDYDKNRLCLCLPEYEIDMGDGVTYGVHITEGYARCDKGQADLTKEQSDVIYSIIRKTNKALD